MSTKTEKTFILTSKTHTSPGKTGNWDPTYTGSTEYTTLQNLSGINDRKIYNIITCSKPNYLF